MSKKTLGPTTLIYPMPVLLVGSNVNGKPNIMAAAWGGIANSEPPMISVAIRPRRYTMKGILENMTFSVNIPSVDHITEADYCGIVSGAKSDKVAACNLQIYYGKLETAPLIEQCPINLECKVVHILNLGSHNLVIGSVEDTHISEECLTDGRPDVAKIKPFAYVESITTEYRAMGENLGRPFQAGKKLK